MIHWLPSEPELHPSGRSDSDPAGGAHQGKGAVSDLSAFLRLPGSETAARAELVVQQLETAVSIGLLVHGQRLPPEGELASQLGVSTGSLRQALTILRQRGVIRTRAGRNGGSVIDGSAAVSAESLTDQLRARTGEELRDLGDHCAAVLGAAARLAAARACEQDLDELRSHAARFRTAVVTDDLGACCRSYSRFRIHLGVAARSPRLTVQLVQLQGEFAPLRWAAAETVTARKRVDERQVAILDAVEAKDGAAAQSLAVGHQEEETRRLIDRHLMLLAGG